MKFLDAREIFSKRASAGEVVDRKSGHARELSANRQRSVISNVRSALCAASGVALSDLDDVEIDPYLASLPEIARENAVRAGRAAPRNEAANVSLFLAAVVGEQQNKRVIDGNRFRPLDREQVLPAWRPMFDSLVELVAQQPTKHGYISKLVSLHDLCLVHGVRDPHAIPDDYDTVIGWAVDAGRKRTTFHRMAVAFRTARERIGDASLPLLLQRTKVHQRALRSLPDLAERLRAAGCDQDPATLPAEDLIRHLAPSMSRALLRHLDWGRKRHRSPDWQRAQVDMTSRWVAALIRIGWAPSSLTFVDLFEQQVVIPTPIAADDVLDEVFDASELGGPEAKQSLLCHLANVEARRSATLSPLSPLPIEGGVVGPGEIPFYSRSLRSDVMNTFLLVRNIFRQEMKRKNPERWHRIEAEYSFLRQAMSDHNESVRLTGQKDKDLVLVLWPQAMFVGLAALRQRAVEAETRRNEFLLRGGRQATAKGRHLTRMLDVSLRKYVLLALLLDDGLRIKNYAGALANVHVIPEVVRDEKGKWISFARVRTCFRGFDAPSVRLKCDKDELGKERIRRRYLTPGIVDHRLFYVYWTEVRPRDLVRRRVLADVNAYDPDRDSYAVFIATKTGRKMLGTPNGDDADKEKSARCTPGHLADIAAETLHWIVRELLNRPDVPAWNDPARVTLWRAVFGPHIVRLLVATYWGGLRGDWLYACHLTDDTEHTLRKNYVRVQSAVLAMKHLRGIEHPHHFDEAVDRMFAAEPGDDWSAFWDAFDAADPATALKALQPQGVNQSGDGVRKDV